MARRERSEGRLCHVSSVLPHLHGSPTSLEPQEQLSRQETRWCSGEVSHGHVIMQRAVSGGPGPRVKYAVPLRWATIAGRLHVVRPAVLYSFFYSGWEKKKTKPLFLPFRQSSAHWKHSGYKSCPWDVKAIGSKPGDVSLLAILDTPIVSASVSFSLGPPESPTSLYQESSVCDCHAIKAWHISLFPFSWGWNLLLTHIAVLIPPSVLLSTL